MSELLLHKANMLKNKLRYLRSNKNVLNLFLSENYKERELEINASVGGDNSAIAISIEKENFKKVAFILNEINEKQLAIVEQEFKNCFNQSLF